MEQLLPNVIVIIIIIILMWLFSRYILSSVKNLLIHDKEIVNQSLSGKHEIISKELELKSKEIGSLMEKVEKKIDQFSKQHAMHFGSLHQSLKSFESVTRELKISSDNLRSLLSNNRLRGAFGQQVAENLLKATGFVEGVTYKKETVLSSSKTRPDLTIFLPNSHKLNIDAKFPFDAFERFYLAKNETEKKQAKADFMQAVRQKLKEVSSRDYINPQENTIDLVVMFVPNEGIYSFIYDEMPEIHEEAMQKKVAIVGPFSFIALLRIIQQAYHYLHFQENVSEIINAIKEFNLRYEEYRKAFLKLGDRLEGVQKQYQEIATTRSNKLDKTIEKILLKYKLQNKELTNEDNNNK